LEEELSLHKVLQQQLVHLAVDRTGWLSGATYQARKTNKDFSPQTIKIFQVFIFVIDLCLLLLELRLNVELGLLLLDELH
jgi:hypothetical protein